jgi:hypothetical protein
MSKKFKGKLCVYCAERRSTSEDHVFAREFILPDDRKNLPKVPACKECNGSKSELEHYLAALFPFGGRHETATVNLETMVPKRLKKNLKLYRFLKKGLKTIRVDENGLVVPTMTLPIDYLRVKSWFALITRGLLWFHWGVYLNQCHSVEVISLTLRGEEFFEKNFLSLRPRARVAGNLGNGTFTYEGAQGVDNPEISVWRFSAFGGMVFAKYPGAPSEISSKIGVRTGLKT